MTATDAAAQQTPRTRLSEHGANGQTYLAYLGTAASFASFGAAIASFSLYLERSGVTLEDRRIGKMISGSRGIGGGMVVLGIILMIWAMLNYGSVARQIERQQFRPPVTGIYAITALILFFGASTVAWLIIV